MALTPLPSSIGQGSNPRPMIVNECSTARPQLLLNNVPLLEWGGDQGFCDGSTRARGKRHDNGKGSFKIVTSLRNHSLGLQHWLSNLL